MPAPLDVDREAVKAHAITHGICEAARAFGLSENTVKAWSARGQWLTPIRKEDGSIVIPPRPVTVRPRATGATSASVAARNSLVRLGDKSRLNLARAVAKGAKHASTLTGENVLANAKDLKALADTGDRIHQWSANNATPTLRLELIAQSQSNDPPVIDVESEVSR